MVEGQKCINGIWSDDMLYNCCSWFVQCYNMMKTGNIIPAFFRPSC